MLNISHDHQTLRSRHFLGPHRRDDPAEDSAIQVLLSQHDPRAFQNHPQVVQEAGGLGAVYDPVIRR